MMEFVLQPAVWGLVAGTAVLVLFVDAMARKHGQRRPGLWSVAVPVGVLLVLSLFGGVAGRGDAIATSRTGRAIEIVAMIGALCVFVGPIAGVLKAAGHTNIWVRAILVLLVGSISLVLSVFAFDAIAGGVARVFD